MFFAIEKIERRLEEIRESIVRGARDIPRFRMREGERAGAHRPDFDDGDWDVFATGYFWGGRDVVAWFRATVPIPREWKGKKLALRFQVGPGGAGESAAEALLYVNGQALQGIDARHEEAWLPPELLRNDEIVVTLKAWSGIFAVPDRRRFKLAQLLWIDEETERFYYLADTVLKTVKELHADDMRRVALLEALNEAFRRIDFLKPRSDGYYRSVRDALVFLEGQVRELRRTDELKPKVVAVGHSHIDMAWLWRLRHTREKAARTFSTVLNLMRQYPEYRFLHSSPQLYKFLKQDYPEIYVKVKEQIAAGAWEITGGMWVEADTNITGGESLIRQFLYGKRFIKEEFGLETSVVWLPDVFGYSWALPQIIKKSGMKYFMTIKLSWNQFNRFPYDTFQWRGIDGTEVLAHFITAPERITPGTSPETSPTGQDLIRYTYNGLLCPRAVKGSWDNYQQKEINDELLLAFGWGDGGGGPTKEMLEAARAMENLPGLPRVELGAAESYFARLEKRLEGKNVPVWDGELYLEYHRGTYTSQGQNKRANRKAEVLYHNAEWLSAVRSLLTGDHPSAELREGWELILLNQFHDILPGSSIHEVYEDSRKDYERIRSIGEKALNDAQEAIVRYVAGMGAGDQGSREGVVVFNPISWERSDLVELPWPERWQGRVFVDEDGQVMPLQIVERDGVKTALLEARGVPSLGYKAFFLAERDGKSQRDAGEDVAEAAAKDAAQDDIIVTPEHLENRFYRIRLNRRGQVVSLYDKRSGREVLARGARANVFQVFEDKPLAFDAWDIDIYYQEKMREIEDLVDAKVEEAGRLRGILSLKWRFFDSTIAQRIVLYGHSPRIDFQTVIDWHERQTLLKVAFPVNARATKATCDIQFGNIERPTHWNTSWDLARFEVVGHKWVDLSEGNYGVALLNDCKYGHDVKDNVLRLTLVKSAVSPDPEADKGEHVFTYSLLPHEGGWREGDVAREAYALNFPLLSRELSCEIGCGVSRELEDGRVGDDGQVGEEARGTQGCGGGHVSLYSPSRYSFAEVDADHVIIETVKAAEGDDGGWIVRVYEYKQNRNSRVSLRFGQPIRRAVECNLVEEDEREVDFQGDCLFFEISPYEIKTFKVWF